MMYLKIGYCTMNSIYKKERATRGRLFQGFCQPMDGNTLDTQEGLTALQEFYTLISFCQENKLVKNLISLRNISVLKNDK